MRQARALLPVLILVALVACTKHPEAADNAVGFDETEDGARYSGIGTYPSDGLWNDIRGAAVTNDAAAAKQGDDSQVIVVLDRRTGEVRQCGNRSGFCIAMNPWTGKGREATPQLPVEIDRHVGNNASHASDAEPARSAQKSSKK